MHCCSLGSDLQVLELEQLYELNGKGDVEDSCAVLAAVLSCSLAVS